MKPAQIADIEWSVVSGCTHVSPGCEHCSAEQFFKLSLTSRLFSQVHCHAERLLDPMKEKTPATFFVNPLGDLFHVAVPEPFRRHAFSVMRDCERHRFLVLTKRPQNISATPWPDNAWCGISVENQQTYDQRRSWHHDVPARHKFVSYEPALEALDLHWKGLWAPGIHWLVVGGEIGPNARPCDPAWIRSAISQAREAQIPCLVKQLGSAAGLHHLNGADPDEWPEDLRVQQYPEGGPHGTGTAR